MRVVDLLLLALIVVGLAWCAYGAIYNQIRYARLASAARGLVRACRNQVPSTCGIESDCARVSLALGDDDE